MSRATDLLLVPSALEPEAKRLARFNATEREFPSHCTVTELIEAALAQPSDQPAIVCELGGGVQLPTLTRRELNEKANQLAALLREKGVLPGQVVGLVVERSCAMMLGILGILKAGGAYLPISPSHPRDRIQYMLKDCAVRVVLTQTRFRESWGSDWEVIDLEDPGVYRGSGKDLPAVNRPEDLAYVIYTSGSTGKPKGVMIEHRSVVNRLHWMQSAYPIGPGDVILQKTPFYFDVSVWELLWWGLAGAKLTFLRPGGEKMPLLIVDAIRRHGISVIHFVPSMLNIFLEYVEAKGGSMREQLASLRWVFASGEALKPSHVKRFNSFIGQPTGARLVNLYGPTEATVDVSYFNCPRQSDVERVPIGRPIDNTRFYILADNRASLIGEPGELCIAGVGLARGYMNNLELTKTRFTDNPLRPGERIYRTGDIARWLPDGNVEYLGRLDHQVKIRGFRIELGEIENTIRDHPHVRDCIAVTRKVSESVVWIIAYVVASAEFQLRALREHLKAQLPDYMVPNHFELIDHIPLTPNGKADRAALPAPKIQLSAT